MFPNTYPEQSVCHWSEKETNKARKCLTTHLFSVSITVFGFVLMLHHRRKIRKLWKGWISISKEVMFSGEVAKVWMEVTSCLSLFTCEILTGWKIKTLWFPLPLTKWKNSWSSANMTYDFRPSDSLSIIDQTKLTVDVLNECCLNFISLSWLWNCLEVGTLSSSEVKMLTKHCKVSRDLFCFNEVLPWQGDTVAQAW